MIAPLRGRRKWRIVRTDHTGWGAPRLEGTRLTVACVMARFAAGERLDELAKDYGYPRAAMEAMAQALCQAAFGSRGLRAAVSRQLDAVAEDV